jgi:hypothetical protein
VYWDADDGTEEAICRRSCPAPSVGPDDCQDHKAFPVWPWTIAEDWCGNHQDFQDYLNRKTLADAVARSARRKATKDDRKDDSPQEPDANPRT